MYKCNPVTLYSVTCMFIFSGLTIWYCIPFGKTFFCPQHYLPACSSCSGLVKFSHSQISMCMAIVLLQVFRQPCWWEFMDVASLIFLGDTVSQQASFPLALTVSLPPLPHWSLRCRSCVVYASVGTGFPRWAFWSVVVLCDALCLLLKAVSLMRGETYLYVNG